MRYRHVLLAMVVSAAAFAGALSACGRAADDCRLNVTCPEDGRGAGGSTSTTSSATTTSSSSSSSGGAGGAMLCAPGEARSCYQGPPGTEGIGACKAGVETCNPEGTAYGACEGQVLPGKEDCATIADEDCDGEEALASYDAGDCPGTPIAAADVTVLQGSDKAHDDLAQAAAIDKDGNLIVGSLVGGFYNASTDVYAPSAIMVSKIDPTKKLVWAYRADPAVAGSTVTVHDVAAAPDGDVVAVGQMTGSVAFGPTTTVATAAGATDAIVIKISGSDGTIRWVKAWTGTQNQRSARGVVVDAGGNIAVSGFFGKEMMIDSTLPGQPVQAAGAGFNAFVVKLDQAGQYVWHQRYGDGIDQRIEHMALDGSGAPGDLVVSGRFKGQIAFGGVTLVADTSDTPPDYDTFVAKIRGLDATPVWAVRFGGPGLQAPQGLAVDAAGAVAVAGPFRGHGYFGATPEVGPLDATVGADPAARDVWVAKLDGSNGMLLWDRGFGDGEDQQVTGAAVDAEGSVIVTGVFKGAPSFGGQSLSHAGSGTWDLWVVKVDAGGAHVHSAGYGDVFNQISQDVTVSPAGHAFVVGGFLGVLDFGPAGKLASDGRYEAFAVELAP